MIRYDVAIIGGGINGSAIARDATLRGLSVILLEAQDFGSGASSKSSKLVHGGLRYLENFHFRLVKESLKERSILVQTASNLVHKIPFILPVYKGHSKPLWMIKLGLTIYDFFSDPDFPKHSNLTKEEILHQFPSIAKEGLIGGCQYFDAQMQDSRLVLENALDAKRNGATLLNYSKVKRLIKEGKKAIGVVVETKNGEQEIYAKAIVHATGATLKLIKEDQKVFLYPTKGVHLVIPQVHPTHALLLTSPQDGRVFFLIPWEGKSLLGTTDTPFAGDPSNPTVEKEDVEYLQRAFSYYFKNTPLQVLSSFAGIRPLVKSSHTNPSAISRDFHLSTTGSGVLTLMGGKFTTYRLMAEKTVDKLTNTPCQTGHLPLSTYTKTSEEIQEIAKKLALDTTQVKRIVHQYGERSSQIFSLLQENSQEKEQICTDHPHLFAELTHAILNEEAKTPQDWFQRRTTIAYTTKCQGLLCKKSVTEHFEKLRGLTPFRP